MKRLKQIIMSLALVVGVGVLLVPVASVGAVNPIEESCQNQDSTICQNQNETVDSLITNVINVLLFVVGIISVVMIIIGGIMYATSAGDSGAVTKAKNTILYAVIGLVVAFLAFAIVNWVVGTLL
ncbi:MAG: pilin [Candidatus Microsaccharimonas sp.]